MNALVKVYHFATRETVYWSEFENEISRKTQIKKIIISTIPINDQRAKLTPSLGILESSGVRADQFTDVLDRSLHWRITRCPSLMAWTTSYSNNFNELFARRERGKNKPINGDQSQVLDFNRGFKFRTKIWMTAGQIRSQVATEWWIIGVIRWKS